MRPKRGGELTHPIPATAHWHRPVANDSMPRGPRSKIRPGRHHRLLPLRIPQRKRIVEPRRVRKVQRARRRIPPTIRIQQLQHISRLIPEYMSAIRLKNSLSHTENTAPPPAEKQPYLKNHII